MVVAAVPAAASAALPEPNRAKIVPFKSIGPIKFGTTQATAFTKWGTGNCAHEDTTGQDTCAWHAFGTPTLPPEGGVLQLENSKVCGMSIQAGVPFQAGAPLAITGLKKWETQEGVGLGSSLRAAKKVLGGELVVRRHQVTTAFSAGSTPSTDRKVQRIHIYKDGCPVT